jgi:oligopeptide/dipeptide ABC transporter ATP-binding protein
VTAPLLSVRELSVAFRQGGRDTLAVDRISFDVAPRETVAIVGESGSGKSVSALSVLKLLPYPAAHHPSGSILFKGRDLMRASENEMRRVRGDDITMVFQEPMSSLNPLHTIERQVGEIVRLHRRLSERAARERTLEMLDLVGLRDAARRLDAYPHQLSGGQRQRVMIAMALANEPDLFIADEPTTALDVTVQAQILELIDEMKTRLGIGVVLISHNLGVIADVAQHVMIMYGGRPVELGTRDEIFRAPRHPYAWGLLESIPRPDLRVERLVPIEGAPPSLINLPPGCSFHPRCPHRFERCDKVDPPLVDADGSGHRDACLLSLEDKRRLWAERLRRFQDAAA